MSGDMGDMGDMMEMMEVLGSENGIASMMERPAFEDEQTGHQYSQADLIADLINILRLDTKRIAEAHDVEIEISKMTPGNAATLLQGVAQGTDMGLIEIFDEIEDQRMALLAEIESEEAMQEYLDQKQKLLYSVPDDADVEFQVGDQDEN